ncbi:MAG TPA: peptidoglycan DD-metalloendopeptidase family protein [Clostridia bacterium]
MMKMARASRRHPGRWLRITAAMVTGVLMVMFAGPSLIGWASSADTEKLIQEAMAGQDANQAQLAKIGAQKAQMAGTVNQYVGELAWLNTLNAQQAAKYAVLLAEKEAALKTVDEAFSALLASQEELQIKEAEYRDRLQVMFEYRNKSVLEVFLESGNLQGFFSNMELIRAVADYDQKMLEELETARDDAELKRQDSLVKQADANALVVVKEAEIEQLHLNIQRSTDVLTAAQAQLADQQAREAQALAQSDEIAASVRTLQARLADERTKEEEERKRKEAEERRRIEASKAEASRIEASKAEASRIAASKAAATTTVTLRESYNGEMRWPVPSSIYITSYFQPYGRTDLPGQTAPHMGVDIGANYGTPVVAVADGTVLMVYNPWEGRNTGGVGYGNYVILDHGGRIATVYAHLRSVKVTTGDAILAGDIVGFMGSTGNSTGPHLHFEVRDDGYPVNPLTAQFIGQP